MISKITIVSMVICSFTLAALLNSCKKQDDRMVEMGPQVRNDLALFFKKTATAEEQFAFTRTVIGVPEETGSGYSNLPGVISTVGVIHRGYHGIALQFHDTATKEQKDFVLKRIQSSPLVYKIYEDVIPNKIEDL